MIFQLLGAALLFIILRDVIQTVVVPRGKMTRFHFAPQLVRRILWPPFRLLTSLIKSAVWKQEILGMFAPVVLMTLLTIWASLLVGAFALEFFALRTEFSPQIDSFDSSLFVAGTSFLTLGSADPSPQTSAARLLVVASAFIGMVLTASVVSLIFVLIGSIQRREALVSLTTNIAPSPPSGIAILETFSQKDGRESLSGFYDDWHRWCADVFETHRAYPILPFFRSSDPFTSWLTTLGAVLDSAALLLSADKDGDHFSVRLMFRFGCRLVNEFAQHRNIDTADSSDLSEEEFHNLYMRLKAADFCLIEEDTVKSNFDSLRKEYAPAHRALCKYVAVPLTPLSTDVGKSETTQGTSEHAQT